MKIRSSLVAAFSLAACSATMLAQVPADRVAARINEAQVVTLEGNVHPLARAEFDQGLLNAETRLDRMLLLLKPSATQQKALDALVAAQNNPHSPYFHRWLTPAEYAARFGASPRDLARIAAWLKGHGFTVEAIPAGNLLIIFSGTAGQVEDTFHSEMHRYRVNGVGHMANAQDPQIPLALAGAVGGIVSLNDFRHAPAIASRRALGSHPQETLGGNHYLMPADLAAIYDMNPLYEAGTTGLGVTIAITGRSNINTGDVAGFRAESGLAANNPAVILDGANPGLVTGDQDESTLDVEWAGAVAPAATVKLVAAASTSTTDGVDLAAAYIVNNNLAAVVSTSYGSCEHQMGATELAFYNSLWEQAASQGISSFVASGDAGAAGCNLGSDNTGSSAGVNGLCSSPYATCVGGTEFNEGSSGGQYWSGSNSANQGSALGYIPETVWNESGTNGGAYLWASGGGASQVYAQPAWQQAVTGASAANGMRAVPDVALSAATHDGYLIEENGTYWIVSGTSAATPCFAAVMAMVVQSKNGKGQGSANPSLYLLASAGANPFHATPAGNNSVPGVAGFTASGAAYNLATGLGSVDAALLVSSWGTGSGEVNGNGAGADFALTASSSSGSLIAGTASSFTLSVTETGSTRNQVSLAAASLAGVTISIEPAAILPGTLATVTMNVNSAAAVGAHSILFTGSDASGSQTATYTLTVLPQPPLGRLLGRPALPGSGGRQ
jgi:subtilase family serine protease